MQGMQEGAGSRGDAGLDCQNPVEPVPRDVRIMPQIVFAPAIQRHQPCPPLTVAGGTVGAALGQAFSAQPQMRDYILDDQGRLRRHVAIFIDGRVIEDRMHLTDAAGENAEIYVVQALSGG